MNIFQVATKTGLSQGVTNGVFSLGKNFADLLNN
jgi:hypothetical protein